MDESWNLKDDDETEDKEGAARVRDEATIWEGEGAKAREVEAIEYEAEDWGEKITVSGTVQGITRKRPRATEARPSKGGNNKTWLVFTLSIVVAVDDNPRLEVTASV